MNQVISPIYTNSLNEAVSTGKHIAWATGRRAVVGEANGLYFAASTGCNELQAITWTAVNLVTVDAQGMPQVL